MVVLLLLLLFIISSISIFLKERLETKHKAPFPLTLLARLFKDISYCLGRHCSNIKWKYNMWNGSITYFNCTFLDINLSV